MERFHRAPSRRRRLIFTLAAILLAATLGRAASPLDIPISNFGEINSNYYRGGQPDREGFAALKRFGIKSVIDLRNDPVRQEADWVRAAGMQYFNLPLSTSRPASAPETEYFLKLVNDEKNWPVYVHCKAGKHRTGEMTAVYRLTHDSWTADRAYQEMRRYKFYSFPFQGSLRDYVYAYFDKLRQALVISSPTQPASAATAAAR
jgi:protein tyrosine phosphatase (PTP) superfamily phosphohydrolase (DUF442 family)